jgi:uncharacterized protein YcaQ
MPDSISIHTARRFILGRQGLWPGRRWHGLPGTELAMLAMRQLQLDPLVVIARAHDLMLQSRVIDYRADDWATLTYEKRRFFEWGGWLAVRPIEELPHWRVLMRRGRSQPRWQEVVKEHGPAIEEMRAVLRERGTVSNRDFAMHTRTRIDSYRGRKDSALALHYLWRVGDAMVARRERFERIYAPTDAIVPASLIRESSDAEADDFLLTKMVAVAGLTQLNGVNASLLRTVGAPEFKAWRERKLADGELIEVRVEGWKGTAACARVRGEDAGRRGGRPCAAGLATARHDDRRRSDLPRPARPSRLGRSREGPFRLRLQMGGIHASPPPPLGLLHAADPVARSARCPVRRQTGSAPPHARHQRLLD